MKTILISLITAGVLISGAYANEKKTNVSEKKVMIYTGSSIAYGEIGDMVQKALEKDGFKVVIEKRKGTVSNFEQATSYATPHISYTTKSMF